MKSSEDVLKDMESEHLGILTSMGRHFLGLAEGAASMLEDDSGSLDKMSDEERQKFFKILLDALRQHNELITWSIEER